MKPKFQQDLPYFGAYALLFFIGLIGLAISWCLRSDIVLLCLAASVPKNIANFLYAWTIPLVIIPWALIMIGLEHYMNEAARRGIVWQRARKLLTIQMVTGLVIVAVMGGLAVAGYPPLW